MTTDDQAALARFEAFWDALPPAGRAAFARDVADGAAADGLTVYRAEDDRVLPIPVVLSPQPVAAATLRSIAEGAEHLLSATIRCARWLYEAPEGEPIARRLFASFTPLEHAALRRDPSALARVAMARLDCFHDPRVDAPRALELNATIPAMQGYSDILLERWIGAVGRARGLPEARIAAARAGLRWNTLELLASVVAHHAAAGGRAAVPSILIVSRPGDAQQGELRHYERAWRAAGHDVRYVTTDLVERDADGHLGAGGRRYDLVYRHIFARRVEPTSPLGRALTEPGPAIVVNPVVSPLEVKGMLALLDEARAQGGAPWRPTDAELDAIARFVPWTRLCLRGPAVLADGTRVPDVAAWAQANAATLVLKRSWDYGGKSVHLGPDDPDWHARVDRAATDDDVWVVQELVPARPVRHLLVEPDGPAWRELYVDVSAYTSHGPGPRPGGSVCRASGSKIVNILGGGGLTPVLPTEVLLELLR